MGFVFYAFCAIVVVICLYIWTYFRTQGMVEIHQATLADFQFDLLREKQPLVIDDRVVSLADLHRMWFGSNITSEFRLDGTETWHKNKFKYLVVHAEQEGDIYLYPAGKRMIEGNIPDTEESLIAVHLLPRQVLIIPFRWHYLVMPPMQISCLGVHDYVTYMLP